MQVPVLKKFLDQNVRRRSKNGVDLSNRINERGKSYSIIKVV